MNIILISLGWIAMAITAYPRRKKWVMESDSVWNSSRNRRWTNDKMLGSMLVCLICWPFVWIWFLGSMIEKLYDHITTSNVAGRLDNWSEREATLDKNILEMFKRLFGRRN